MDKERLFRYLDRKYSSKSEIIPNIPLGEDANAIWAEILQSRRERGIELPLINVNGEAYWYILTNKMISASEVIVEELLEQENTAELHKSPVATIEEIYYTGFMEGAQISVQDAMDFLQSGTEPESVEELILMNSRQAAGFAADNMYHAIDSNYLHNLAYFLTEGLDNGGGDYRLTDTVEIPSLQGEVVQLPPAAMIPEQTERFAEFLADTATHPLIKAAAAQAWVLAYRPFPEGNERLARLLSNVILIRAGYAFFGNISISSVIARTSYEYFRAIANILRIENGADLTYFLEYYLVTLSSAVNDMRARREHKSETVVEAEQKMAVLPLNAAPEIKAEDKETKNIGNPVILNKHKENTEKVHAALERLKHLGYEQFTLHDIEAITGVSRKYISKLLLPYEESGRIIAVRKSKVGNIYSFKQSARPEDKMPAINVDNKKYEIDDALRKDAISAIKERIRVGTKNASVVGRALLKMVKEGVFRFTMADIEHKPNLSNVALRNTLNYYLRNNIIRVKDNSKRFFLYEFSFIREYTDDKEHVIKSSQPDIVYNDYELDKTCEAFPNLIKYAKETGNDRNTVARVLMNFIKSGKLAVTSEEMAKHTGMKYNRWHNAIRPFIRMGLFSRTGYVVNGQKCYTINVGSKPHSQTGSLVDEHYSSDILDMLRSLINAEHAPKDNRIGEIIYSCLEKGTVTAEDYRIHGAENKLHGDMRFAEKLGIVKKKSEDTYEIMRNLSEHEIVLEDSMKNTLTMLYDIFGEDAFSVEMVVAKLDYSESHMSATLHQLAWLKILDSFDEADRKRFYHFLVNPTDNPELFKGEAA